jgi:hypothetical protein
MMEPAPASNITNAFQMIGTAKVGGTTNTYPLAIKGTKDDAAIGLDRGDGTDRPTTFQLQEGKLVAFAAPPDQPTGLDSFTVQLDKEGGLLATKLANAENNFVLATEGEQGRGLSNRSAPSPTLNE